LKAEITFNVETNYIQTGFKELIKIGNYKWIDKQCIWTFPVKHIRKVENILGHPIEFDKYHILNYLKKRMPLKKEQAYTPEFKGKGEIVIKLLDELKKYEILEYRKVENKNGEIEIKERRHMLPQGLVQCMQDVLYETNENQYKGHKIGCRSIAEKMTNKLHIDRFNRKDTGTFDWQKFFGDRKSYYNFYYLPLKVLAHKKMIIHHKNGKISKINKNKFWGENGSDNYNQANIWDEET